MNILVIDCWYASGYGRAGHLAQRLRDAGHVVDVYPYVSGHDEHVCIDDPYEDWSPELKKIVQGMAAGRSLVFLHVGRDQSGAEYALLQCFSNNHVVCFTGAKPPEWCLTDCRENQLHGFISGDIPRANQWPEWSAQQLLKACRLIESDDWTTARNMVSSFDPHLEESLNALYAALKNNAPCDELRQMRERRLGS